MGDEVAEPSDLGCRAENCTAYSEMRCRQERSCCQHKSDGYCENAAKYNADAFRDFMERGTRIGALEEAYWHGIGNGEDNQRLSQLADQIDYEKKEAERVRALAGHIKS
jgi:hypothetical protein